jgi:hypothetical protein
MTKQRQHDSKRASHQSNTNARTQARTHARNGGGVEDQGVINVSKADMDAEGEPALEGLRHNAPQAAAQLALGSCAPRVSVKHRTLLLCLACFAGVAGLCLHHA